MSEALIVITTVETEKDGKRLAERLVEGGLAACVQILPSMTSIYRWEGGIEKATETLILIKTTRAAYLELEAMIKQEHSYQTPEIIAIPILMGSKEYLTWLYDSLRPPLGWS